MGMSDLEVLEMIREVIIESLQPKEELRRRDIWTTCKLRQDLYATDWEDWLDLAFRFNRAFSLDIDLRAFANELEAQITVADVVALIRSKLQVLVLA